MLYCYHVVLLLLSCFARARVQKFSLCPRHYWRRCAGKNTTTAVVAVVVVVVGVAAAAALGVVVLVVNLHRSTPYMHYPLNPKP